MNRPNRTLIQPFTAVLAILSSPLIAQSENSDPVESEESSVTTLVDRNGKDIHWSSTASTTYFNETDFDDNTGSLESWSTKAGIAAAMDLGEGRLNIGFDAEQISYDFTAMGGGGSSFDDVTTLSVSSTYFGRIDDNSSWFAGATARASYESGASFDDSIAGGAFGGYRHKVSDKLDLGLGIGVFSRLEDDILIVPIPQIRYDMGNGWTLENERIGIKLNYKMNDSVSMALTGEYKSRSFRLDDSNAVSAGATSESKLPVSFSVQYAPNNKVNLHGRIGAAFGGELEFFNAAGTSVSTRDLETSVFFGFGGSIRF
ncbi:MAG: hypothetical protein P1U42_05030 [Phycisphaerales bacterium]|nr:hypothetical protein [Phycisphaerales bacterium]